MLGRGGGNDLSSTDILAVTLAAGMFNKTHNIVSIEG
jgi:hypothetical protein